jgi:NADH dehydrogenase FAD-containing subunit
VIEMREEIALDSEIFYRTAVKVEFRKTGVKVLTKTSGQKITDKGIYVKNEAGEESFLEADTVVSAVGYRADESLFLELCNSAPIVNRIGDCRKAGKVADAVREAYYMALDI